MPPVARHTLTLVSGPTIEPVTEEEAKSWAKIDTDEDDAIVGQLITAARMSAEEFLRRSLITQTWQLTLDLSGSMLNQLLVDGTYDLPISYLYGVLGRQVELPKGPVQSITSVTCFLIDNSSSVFDPSNYYLDDTGARLVLNIGAVWTPNMRPRHAVEILYKAGYGDKASDVPQPIRTGMLIHVASMYEQRGQSADAMGLPPGTRQLYNQYRAVGDRL